MRVIGVLSGTSYDAVEVAAAEFLQTDSLVEMRLLGATSMDMPTRLQTAISGMLPPGTTTLEDVCRLDVALGEVFAEAARHGRDSLCGGRADLVCCPGQTVFHWVEDGRARGSLQLARSTTIAEKTGLPVVFDLYNRDIACGGQGAPLDGFLSRLIMAGISGPRATLNIGGIANMTVITSDETLLCYDLGPGNALIDAAVAHFTNGRERFDRDGVMARRGRVDPPLLRRLLADPYYSKEPPKSTGKELFNLRYLESILGEVDSLTEEDVVATLTQHTAEIIANECRKRKVAHLIGSGGGMLNPALLERLTLACAPTRLVTSESVGIPVTSVEAYCIAFLGYLAAGGVEAAIPSCTGAHRPSIMGSMTPGRAKPGFAEVAVPTVLRIVGAEAS